jgi:hypothetical protein
VEGIQDGRLDLLHVRIAYRHLLPRLLAEFGKRARADSQRNPRLVTWDEHRAAAKSLQLDKLVIFEH